MSPTMEGLQLALFVIFILVGWPIIMVGLGCSVAYNLLYVGWQMWAVKIQPWILGDNK